MGCDRAASASMVVIHPEGDAVGQERWTALGGGFLYSRDAAGTGSTCGVGRR
jgi:hypothetical protein